MNRNFHNSRGSSTNPRNQNSHWRIVLIALLLALAVGTAQLPLAQAADPNLSILAQPTAQPTALRASVVYIMNPINPKKTLCFGEKVIYTLNVYRRLMTPPPTTLSGMQAAGGRWSELYIRPGVKVEATSSDTSIGTFARPGYGHTGEEFDGTNNVEFQFTAKKKLGTTNLYFEAVVNDQDGGGYVTATVPVKVIPCKYEIRTNSTWVFATPYGTAFFFESMKAKMTVDEQGYLTSASESGVAWVYTQFIPNYASSTSISRGTADLSGRIDENGQLVLNIKFSSVDAADTNCGAPGCGGGTFTALADPLTIRLPAAGGTSLVPHSLTAAGQSITGNTTVTVIPIDGAQ